MFNPDGTARPEQALQAGLVRAANDAGKNTAQILPREFNFILEYLKRVQDTIQRHARILPTHHKSIWGKWKKRRKLAKRERKNENHGPVSQKPHREHGDAAYRYDEYDQYVRMSDLEAGCEQVFKSILGGFMHRREMIGTNNHLMRGLDTWEDHNGFRRQS